jgi:hypothetical protein
MKRLAGGFLFIGLITAVGVLCPLKAHAKWVVAAGKETANPYSIQVSEIAPSVLRLKIGINGFDLQNASESATKTRRVYLEGLTPIEEAGEPDVPRLVRALRVPDGTSPRFEIVEQEKRTFSSVKVGPSRGPIVIGEDPLKKKTSEGVGFKLNRFYPPTVFELIEPFQIRDTRGVKFAFAPFRYNPIKEELQVITQIVIDVFFDPTDQAETLGMVGINGRKHKRSPVFDRIESSVFLNGPTPAEAYSTGPRAMGSFRPLDATSGEENMLIITTPAYSSTLQSFIQWKQSQEINVELDTTSASGGVSAIQNTIQSMYDTQGLTYVLLVGNLTDVPSPMVTLISQKPSDPYYVALSGSNTVPSALISRLPVNSTTELQIELAKITHYGQSTLSNDSWVNNALVGACASNPNDTGEANTIVSAMLANPLNFTSAQRVLSTDSNPAKTVTNAFESKGLNMFTYVGHGTETDMLSFNFSTTQALALTDTHGAYPFVHTVACRLGDFSYPGGCLAQAILKAGTTSAPAGAVAIAASTEDMYAGHGDRGQQMAFTNYYYSPQYETLGSLFFSSEAYAISCLTGTLAETLYRQWHLFGDCSLPVRKISSQTPTASVVVPAQVNEGAGLLPGQGSVVLSKATTSQLTVNLSSSDSTKASVPATVVVPAGATSAPFDITVYDDMILNGNQTVQICASISGEQCGCSQMTILETDGGLVSFSSSSYVAANGSASITLVRTGSIHGTISVNLQTSDGTAVAGTDYTAQAMAVTFTDGQTQQTISIPVSTESHEDPAESFNVSLTGAYAGSLNSAVVTIPANYSVDYFTEQSLCGNNLSFQSFSFVPDGSANFYSAFFSPVAAFYTDPTGSIPLTLGDNSYAQINLTGGATVSFYGKSYSTLFVGSNGYITFTAGDTTSTPSLQSQFALPRISALFDDLDPSAGGSISWRQLADGVAVTFQNVPEKGTTNSNSFQVEIFFDGAIRITWLGVQASNVLVGLSAGPGQVPTGFVQSDLSAYGAYSWQLNLSILGTLGSDSVSESAGVLKSGGTIAVNAPLFFDLNVTLFSSDPTRLTVPASVTVPAGQTQVQFDIMVINDCIADGDHTVSITALAANFPSIQYPITIIDAGALPGDLNANCIVDFDDLNILLNYIGAPVNNCPACDLNGDGVIDYKDVSLLESYCTCSGCVCPTTKQKTDPTAQPVNVPALGEYGYAFLLLSFSVILAVRRNPKEVPQPKVE